MTTAAPASTDRHADGWRAPLQPYPYRVARVERRSHDTVSVSIDASDRPLRFEPGQFSMLYVHGMGSAPISISSDPAEPTLVEHTIRDVGVVTGALVRLRAGDVVGVRGPFGRPWPMGVARGRHLVVIGGGIGLAPVRPAVLDALARLDEHRSLHVLVGARSPADLLFADDLERWRDLGAHLGVTVDAAGPPWRGRVGLVTRLVRELAVDPVETTVLCCGPEVMLRFVARETRAVGVPDEALWVTTERTMRCGVGTCGHCQLGPFLLCRQGPVFSWPEVGRWLEVREL